MKRAVLQCSDVSGFRSALRRCASTSAKGANRFKGKKPSSFARKTTEKEVVVAAELRDVLSPEACAWLEGQPYKADKKGKRRVSAILREGGL